MWVDEMRERERVYACFEVSFTWSVTLHEFGKENQTEGSDSDQFPVQVEGRDVNGEEGEKEREGEIKKERERERERVDDL